MSDKFPSRTRLTFTNRGRASSPASRRASSPAPSRSGHWPWPNLPHNGRIRLIQLLRRRLIRIFAKIRNDALWTRGHPCHTDIASVKEQPMMCVLDVLLRSRGREPILNRAWRFAWSQPRAIGYTKNMGVHGNFVLAVHHVENDARCLAAHAWKCLERVTVVGDFAAMLIYDLLCKADEILGLRVV